MMTQVVWGQEQVQVISCGLCLKLTELTERRGQAEPLLSVYVREAIASEMMAEADEIRRLIQVGIQVSEAGE